MFLMSNIENFDSDLSSLENDGIVYDAAIGMFTMSS